MTTPDPSDQPAARLTPLVRQVLTDAAAQPGPPPAAAAAQVYARGLRARRRHQMITAAVVAVALIALVVGVTAATTVLRPDAAPVGPAISPSGAAPTTPSTAPASPTGGTDQGTLSSPPAISAGTSPGQHDPVFSVSDAYGPYCGTDPAEGPTVRDVLPAHDRWGPDLPPGGICSNDMRGVEVSIIQGSRVGVVDVMTYLVNPRVARDTACRDADSCEQVSAGWLGTSSAHGVGATLVTADGTEYSAGASATFTNSDMYDNGEGKLPGLTTVPYSTDQLRQLVLALAQRVHVQ